MRSELFRFLQARGYDVKRPISTTKDRLIARRSLKEQRVLITNDHDFAWYPKKAIFSVLLLRVPQYDRDGLIRTVSMLLQKEQKFEGFIFVVRQDAWSKEELLEKNV